MRFSNKRWEQIAAKLEVINDEDTSQILELCRIAFDAGYMWGQIDSIKKFEKDFELLSQVRRFG